MVVRGEEAKGVKFWGFGKKFIKNYSLLWINYGDIDPLNGRDVGVEFLTAEETGASFPKTNIRVKPNQTPITEDKAQLENILENQKDITEVYQELSYDELSEALNNWLTPDNEESTEESKEESVPASTLKTAVSSTENVSDAFDDLFNS